MSEQPPAKTIRPASGIILPDVPELWRHRQVVSALVWRNVARRYRQTLLGPVWYLAGPLVRMVVLSLVLGRLAKLPSDGIPYPLFTYAAILPWELFSSGVKRSTSCLVTYQGIIRKLYFPRIILPIVEVLTALVDFGLSFVILIIMVLAYGFDLTPRLFMLPAFLLLAMGMALSIGLLTASLHARYRDIAQFVGYGIQFWFYGTPVAYSSSLVNEKLPDWLAFLYWLNPMNGVVEGFRWSLVDAGRAPDMSLAVSVGFIAVCLSVGVLVFLRTEHSIVDLV